ncbi:MAG: helix-turn-helix domain-containing protein [Loktanella sp.]|nr:helix-turn-helix domain-containing protein [Loktanella sp.]
MTTEPGLQHADHFPPWVPEAVRNYLVHTEAGLSIRAVARANACHPSTILRQVRRLEIRRDDLLIDGALKSLSARTSATTSDCQKGTAKMTLDNHLPETMGGFALTQHRIDQEALRILRRLCEYGAVLAAARDMDTAVVVRETQSGEQLRTTSVDREIAQAMALKDWIACADPEARVARYFITGTGRAALRRLTAQEENRAGGFADHPTAADAGWDMMALDSDSGNLRYHNTESPLTVLARRRDRDGGYFLSRALVATGERLREDFELAQLATGDRRGWHRAALGQIPPVLAGASATSRAAHDRLRAALHDLGPGLGDVVLRCCCLLEGLEQTEKTMGWSARSGKIVLRIGLDRLARHYAQLPGGPLIG